MVLELKEKIKHKSCEDSSPFWGKNTNRDATPKLRVSPHSKYFSTLCLVDVMKVESPKQMMNFENEEENSYILEFIFPKGYTTTPIVKAKKPKDQCPFSGFLRLSSFPNEHIRKFDAKLGKRFKSLKWHDRTCVIKPLYFPNAP